MTWLAWRNFGAAPRDRFTAVCGLVAVVMLVSVSGSTAYSLLYRVSGVRACLAGDGAACLGAAARYQSGNFVPKVPAVALRLLQRACDTPPVRSHGTGASFDAFFESEPVRACVHLGRMYELGKGVEKGGPRAAEYYARSCDVGYPPGCEALAAMLDAGGLVDEKRARQAFTRAAEEMRDRCEQDHPEPVACLWLADAHREGRWLVADLEHSEAYAIRACGAGDLQGCDQLVSLWGAPGYGDPARVESGLRWVAERLDRSCSGVRPSPLACAKLGRAYERGQGVPRDAQKGQALLATYCPQGSTFHFQPGTEWRAYYNPWDALWESTWWTRRAEDLARECEGYPLQGGRAGPLRLRELAGSSAGFPQ
jgi:TPR repeat protein